MVRKSKKPVGPGVLTVALSAADRRYEVRDSSGYLRGFSASPHVAVGCAKNEAREDSRRGIASSVWVKQQDGSYQKEYDAPAAR